MIEHTPCSKNYNFKEVAPNMVRLCGYMEEGDLKFMMDIVKIAEKTRGCIIDVTTGCCRVHMDEQLAKLDEDYPDRPGSTEKE